MQKSLSILIKRLSDIALSDASVIPWSCPIPSFGNLLNSRVATLGLNPSNREFVDSAGEELDGPYRRFHTLKSLGIGDWRQADSRHLRLIIDSCQAYFSRNPYDTWFKRLDYIVSGTRASYYNPLSEACHLDLIPYATACKWTDLSSRQRSLLLSVAGDTVGLLLRDSPVRVLILNGSSVVKHFQAIAGIELQKKPMRGWALRRSKRHDVMGLAYRGKVREVARIRLKRDILVLGFNHNIQSSFGVTTEVKKAIRCWVGRSASEVLL